MGGDFKNLSQKKIDFLNFQNLCHPLMSRYQKYRTQLKQILNQFINLTELIIIFNFYPCINSKVIAISQLFVCHPV